MVVFPELTALVRAARACALPPARRSPEAWTPDYPSTMLALSNTAPPAMARQRWCLADYHLVAKLYKGYASNVYKATCKRSNQVVVLKVGRPRWAASERLLRTCMPTWQCNQGGGGCVRIRGAKEGACMGVGGRHACG
eukprot:15404-Chlamydomonas_euryale.AAC.5